MEENFDKETEVTFIVSILFSFWRFVIGSLYKKRRATVFVPNS